MNIAKNFKIYFAATRDYHDAVFNNVAYDFRLGAFLVGNANGAVTFAALSLASSMASDWTINDIYRVTSRFPLTVSAVENADKSANVTVHDVGSWGNYWLIVFYRH